jgi:hypothetical protein
VLKPEGNPCNEAQPLRSELHQLGQGPWASRVGRREARGLPGTTGGFPARAWATAPPRTAPRARRVKRLPSARRVAAARPVRPRPAAARDRQRSAHARAGLLTGLFAFRPHELADTLVNNSESRAVRGASRSVPDRDSNSSSPAGSRIGLRRRKYLSQKRFSKGLCCSLLVERRALLRRGFVSGS